MKLGLYRLALAALLAFLPVATRSQPIVPADDGTGTIVILNGNQFLIQGGTAAQRNLFHSFLRFGLSAEQIATFLSEPQIANILARIGGGEPSIIDGLLQVSGSPANLYLMNPAGIVFGPTARLAVPGDFFATTADQIGFSDGGWFNAFEPTDYDALTGTPNQFAFLSAQPGAVVNAGTLTVATGQRLGLFGGTVTNSGTLQAPGGRVTLAAVPGERLVRISQPGMLLSLEVAPEAIAAGIDPLQLPVLLTGTDRPATAAGRVAIAGLVWGGTVDLAAAERVVPSDPALVRTGDGSHSAPTVTRFASEPEAPLVLTVIDATVADYQTLLYGGEPGTVAMVVVPEEAGIAAVGDRLSAIAASGERADAVQIIAEGNAGHFWLGRDLVSSETVISYQEQLASWRDALSPEADLLLYSCFTALGTAGETLLATLARATGADIAASTNLTGSAALGGDWQLEARTGPIEAASPLAAEAIATYAETLATFLVSNGNNAGSGSLRQAIADANAALGADEIRFAPAITLVSLTTPDPLDLTSALQINGDLTITAPTAAVTIERAATAPNIRVINIAGGNVTLNNLVIRNGNSVVFGGGGGLRNTGGTLTLNNSQITGNQTNANGGYGGGIFSTGQVTINNSTISHNQTLGTNSSGGGIFITGNPLNLTNSTLSGNQTLGTSSNGGAIRGNAGGTIRNSTIVNNSVSLSNGGGLAQVGGTWTIENSIIANNRDLDNGSSPDLDGNFAGSSFNSSLIGNTSGMTGGAPTNGTNGNFVGVDPGLLPLGNYGGPTLTHALRPDSPALNAGDNALIGGATSDQRGAARIGGSRVDIGAYESAGFGLAPVTSSNTNLSVETVPSAIDVSVRFVETAFNTTLPVAGIGVTYATIGNATGFFRNGTSLFTDAEGIARNSFTLQSGSRFQIVASTASFGDLTFNISSPLSPLAAGPLETSGLPEPFTQPQPLELAAASDETGLLACLDAEAPELGAIAAQVPRIAGLLNGRGGQFSLNIAPILSQCGPLQELAGNATVLERALQRWVSEAIGAEFAPLVSATLLPAADTSRLLVRVAPAPQPAFVAGDEFYLDDGELRQLVGPARDDYIEQRWQD